jgi:Gametolysin peptidase M11
MKAFSPYFFVSWTLAFLSFYSAVRANALSSQLRGGSAASANADGAQGAVTAPDGNDSLFETDLTSLRAMRSLLSNDTVVCRVTVDIQAFENGSDVETVMCIPIRDGVESDRTVPIPSTNFSELIAMHNHIVVEQGVFVVTISGVVTLKRARMELTPESQLQVLPPEDAAVHYDDPQVRRRILRSEQEHRQLAVTGTKTVAIVRVMAGGTYNNVTKAQLMSAWFGSQATSFKNQMSLCSNSALQYVQGPYYDITLSQSIKSFSSQTSLQAAIENKLLAVAKKPLNTIASHVVYCYPAKSPGGVWYSQGTCLPCGRCCHCDSEDGSHVAHHYASLFVSGTMNHYRTMYNHNWCASLSGAAHEIGHNYGLFHSSAGGSEFGDRSGYMGSSSRFAGTCGD